MSDNSKPLAEKVEQRYYSDSSEQVKGGHGMVLSASQDYGRFKHLSCAEVTIEMR